MKGDRERIHLRQGILHAWLRDVTDKVKIVDLGSRDLRLQRPRLRPVAGDKKRDVASRQNARRLQQRLQGHRHIDAASVTDEKTTAPTFLLDPQRNRWRQIA